jgi:hypothetical protein
MLKFDEALASQDSHDIDRARRHLLSFLDSIEGESPLNIDND